MQSIYVRITGLKYRLRKQKAIGIVNTFEYLDIKTFNGILNNEKCGLLMVKVIYSS